MTAAAERSALRADVLRAVHDESGGVSGAYGRVEGEGVRARFGLTDEAMGRVCDDLERDGLLTLDRRLHGRATPLLLTLTEAGLHHIEGAIR